MPAQNPLKSLWQGHMCRDDGTSWQGVLCYYNRVAAVNVNGMNLTGEAFESALGGGWRCGSLCISPSCDPTCQEPMACGVANLLSHAGTLPASFANLSALYLVLNLNNNHLSGVQDALSKVGNSVHVYSYLHS